MPNIAGPTSLRRREVSVVGSLPPSVAEVKQQLRYQILVNTPESSDFLIADTNEPKWADIDYTKPMTHLSSTGRTGCRPAKTFRSRIGTLPKRRSRFYIQLQYWISAFGENSFAEVKYNLFVVPYLVVTTYDEE